MQLKSTYTVIIHHPKWLPEGEETEFACDRKALRLEESAQQAGFGATTIRNPPIKVSDHESSH